MEKDNNYVNDPGDEDQGGRRPDTKKKDIEEENESTGYGHKRKSKDEKKSGSGIEEFIEKKADEMDNME